MKKCNYAVLFLVLLCQAATADVQSSAGKISNVIVYRGQALVTRTIDIDSQDNDVELVIGPLPERIISESLYSQAPDNIKVLSVRYREKAIARDTRQEVMELDKQIKDVQNQIYEAERRKGHNDNQWSMFIKLRDFTVTAKNQDIDRGLLTFEPIKELAEFIQQKGQEYIEQTLVFEDQINQLKEKNELLNRKRADLAAGHNRTERQAVVFLSKTDKKPVTIELSYLVDGADWSPQYNLRAQPDKSLVQVEYNAVVHQSSGEDWNNANLALSTAKPTLIAAPPALEPMEITLIETSGRHARGVYSISMPAMEMDANQIQYGEGYSYVDQTERFESLIRSRRSNISLGKNAQSALNSIAFENQMMELNADKNIQQQMKAQVAVVRRTEGVSVMYKLPGRLSLPSRSDQQLLTIATNSSKADFLLYATPLLTDYVYMQADISNSSDTIFLPGPASMYRNGEFVGKGDMSLVTIGQNFTAGFGIDSQIQVTREFKDKKSETLWGNRIDKQEYKIEINSYKNEAVNLCLLERLPFSENPNIEILLAEMSHELSKDAEYVRTKKDKGILRWDLQLKPNSIADKATVVTYSYTMKYDNDMTIKTVAKRQ